MLRQFFENVDYSVFFLIMRCHFAGAFWLLVFFSSLQKACMRVFDSVHGNKIFEKCGGGGMDEEKALERARMSGR